MYNAHTIISLQIKQDCQAYKNKKKSVSTDIIECKYEYILYTFLHDNNLIYIIMLSNKHEK